MVWLLDDFYDVKHRAYMISEKRMELKPFKIRYHGVSSDKEMPYDERYTPYIEMAGLLPFIQLVSRSTPNFNAAALTALIDRWRPETHSFHLRTGEMTVTLQDVSMILALPIEGKPVAMDTDSEGWRQKMFDLIGDVPPVPENPSKGRVSAGAPYTWIIEKFKTCPEGADDDLVKTYARVYMWYVISRCLFADGNGRNAPWIWLKALTIFDYGWSWGSAALAYLYRQLDDACRRTTASCGVGGSMLLLSVWSWDRIPVGRPREINYVDWEAYGNNPLRRATWAYKYDIVSEAHSDTDNMYRQYMNELDALTPEQVDWEPYGKGNSFGVLRAYDLNPKCMEEQTLWLMRCPLICNWAIEFHLPHRVLRQFGLFQAHPPEWKDTDKLLHDLDRRKQRKVTNWERHHKKYITEFELCVEEALMNGWGRRYLKEHCPIAFDNYIRWFLENTRVEICPPAFEEEILEEPIVFDELAQIQYNKMVREGHQTDFSNVLNFVRTEIKKQASESEELLATTPGGEKGESIFRGFVKRSGQRLRRLANLIGCRDPEYSSPSQSRSKSPSDPVDSTDHELEDDTTSVEGARIPDNMTLRQAKQRSAYMLRKKTGIHRYTPDDWIKKGKEPHVEEPRRSATVRRMRLIEDDDDDDEDDEEEEQPAPVRRDKIPTKRGRARK